MNMSDCEFHRCSFEVSEIQLVLEYVVLLLLYLNVMLSDLPILTRNMNVVRGPLELVVHTNFDTNEPLIPNRPGVNGTSSLHT